MENRRINPRFLDRVESAHRNLLTEVIQQGFDPPVIAPVTIDTLIDHVATQLAPHKRPREIRFVEALPRNAMGKIQKKLLE